MKKSAPEKIIYSINTDDLQEVAEEVLERRLTQSEIALVQDKVGDHIDWFQAIENAIQEQKLA